MKILEWVLLILCVLYGGTTIFAGAVQVKQKKIKMFSILMMIFGGALIILSSIKFNIGEYYLLTILILGLLLIHISSILNGRKLYGKIQIKHHIIRLVISILLIVLKLCYVF